MKRITTRITHCYFFNKGTTYGAQIVFLMGNEALKDCVSFETDALIQNCTSSTSTSIVSEQQNCPKGIFAK